ncbi:unnamed protein product [Hermetia illucens]|uniref:OTU domain-containing protein n=1 Tax=Hermetia illucens TaxID=343691 RepID=A0A7R8V263_HERIL|nr:unnamed protein product [Hermetia illucens]
MADSLEDGDNDESISNRHRRERKDLQAKIQSLKKKARQELNELNNAKSAQTTADAQSNVVEPLPDSETGIDSQPQVQSRVTKAQKRRDKKAKEEREREAEIQAQEELNKNGPRIVELQTILKKLSERVIHQLDVTGRKMHDVRYLRNETANYIVENKDTLICYMTNPETGDLLTDEEFSKYCDSIRDTPAWGGQVEIKALSHVLHVPIEVLQATGPPTIQGEGEFPGPPLILTYHRLMYSLGEHYNSTKKQGIVTEDANDSSQNVI